MDGPVTMAVTHHPPEPLVWLNTRLLPGSAPKVHAGQASNTGNQGHLHSLKFPRFARHPSSLRQTQQFLGCAIHWMN